MSETQRDPERSALTRAVGSLEAAIQAEQSANKRYQIRQAMKHLESAIHHSKAKDGVELATPDYPLPAELEVWEHEDHIAFADPNDVEQSIESNVVADLMEVR